MQWILAMIMPLLEKFGIKINELSPEDIAGWFVNPTFGGFLYFIAIISIKLAYQQWCTMQNM